MSLFNYFTFNSNYFTPHTLECGIDHTRRIVYTNKFLVDILTPINHMVPLNNKILCRIEHTMSHFVLHDPKTTQMPYGIQVKTSSSRGFQHYMTPLNHTTIQLTRINHMMDFLIKHGQTKANLLNNPTVWSILHSRVRSLTRFCSFLHFIAKIKSNHIFGQLGQLDWGE